MFDLGWTEMLVIAIVLIVIVGPKDLPKMLRTFGRSTSKLRSMAGDFRKQFDEALKEAELGDVKDLVSDVRKLNPANEIKQALNPMQKAAADVRAGLDAAMNPKKPETSGAAVSAAATAAAVAKPETVTAPATPAPAAKPASTPAKAPARKTAAPKTKGPAKVAAAEPKNASSAKPAAAPAAKSARKSPAKAAAKGGRS